METATTRSTLHFHISAMSCGHCLRAITETVHQIDRAARVEADLPAHTVMVETSAERGVVVAALSEAGYRPD
ncbi:MAG TPA: heavy-metal-associated domain-containing protein [Burkholderiaceae bacterium]|nr:heavy-metal-associated domain-containing protein [Burkholderiaceae bacterium]